MLQGGQSRAIPVLPAAKSCRSNCPRHVTSHRIQVPEAQEVTSHQEKGSERWYPQRLKLQWMRRDFATEGAVHECCIR